MNERHHSPQDLGERGRFRGSDASRSVVDSIAPLHASCPHYLSVLPPLYVVLESSHPLWCTMKGRFASAVVLAALLLAILSVAECATDKGPQPLKLSSKSDFGILEPEHLGKTDQEVWLCPYAFSSVPVDPSNPLLKEILSNFTDIINKQFNYTQYGPYRQPLSIQFLCENATFRCPSTFARF